MPPGGRAAWSVVTWGASEPLAGGTLLRMHDNVVLVHDGRGAYRLWLYDRSADGGCAPPPSFDAGSVAPRRVPCACSEHELGAAPSTDAADAQLAARHRCSGDGPPLLLPYLGAADEKPKWLPEAHSTFAEFGVDRLLASAPALPLGWDGQPLLRAPSSSAAAAAIVARDGLGRGTQVRLWGLQSEAGPSAASSSASSAAAAGSTEHAWAMLGVGRTGPPPCDLNECAACTAAPGVSGVPAPTVGPAPSGSLTSASGTDCAAPAGALTSHPSPRTATSAPARTKRSPPPAGTNTVLPGSNAPAGTQPASSSSLTVHQRRSAVSRNSTWNMPACAASRRARW